jgi:hypothetical protein
MTKRIQRKPRRYRPERVAPAPPPHHATIQEAITILGGVTGLIVAILWLAGRFYASGYFGAMNIPAYQINFSVWEYAEIAWSRLIFYFLNKLYYPLVVTALVFLISLMVVFVLQRLFPRLKLVTLLDGLATRLVDFPARVRGLLTVVLVLYFIFLLLDSFIEINRSGQQEGKATVLTKSYSVEVYSKEPLPLGAPRLAPNAAPALLEYSGLRLLTFNNGKYYLFREVDPQTCKPAQVFIISDSSDTHLVLSAVSPVAGTCSPTPVTVATPTP